MVGWSESEQIAGDSEGQESLAYAGPWGCKESDTIEQSNKNNPLDGQSFVSREKALDGRF